MRKCVSKSTCWGGFLVWVLTALPLGLAGCGDNPDSKAAKEVRAQTESAVEASVESKDYAGSQQKVMGTLVRNRPTGLTSDTARLASGNLAFARGQQMQSELALKLLPVRGSVTKFEKLLRDSEDLFVEKEKLSALLDAGDQEIQELTSLLNGAGETTGLTDQFDTLNDQADAIKGERAELEMKRDTVQKTLDDYQSKADSLLRQAELAKGDRRLSLEQQAYQLLQDRKKHYVEFQAIENDMAVLDSQLELLNERIKLTKDSIAKAEGRIKEIQAADSRKTLRTQIREIEESLGLKQQQMSTIVGQINAGYKDYIEYADQTLAVFTESISEFEKVRSGDAGFMAMMGQAESTYQAALTVAEKIKAQKFLAECLNGLLSSCEPSMQETYERAIQVPEQIQTDLKIKLFELYDASVSAYDEAASRVQSVAFNNPEDRKEAQCSVVKSKLLVLYSKMKFADMLSEYDLANETESLIDETIAVGTELGDCFTQSEALQIVNAGGLNYMPSIPLNMQVFVEGKKQELSGWKRLPLAEQEAAIDENLAKIEALGQEYGQDVAQQLESVKQEMLTAKERGFEETTGSSREPGEPNSF